ATSRGVDVVHLGPIATDMLYFASGKLSLPGVVITASHNPPRYNGLKFCRAGAAPVGEETGLPDIRALAERDQYPAVSQTGSVSERDVLHDYVDHALLFIDADALSPLTVVTDTANGLGGLVGPAAFGRL